MISKMYGKLEYNNFISHKVPSITSLSYSCVSFMLSLLFTSCMYEHRKTYGDTLYAEILYKLSLSLMATSDLHKTLIFQFK